MNGIPPLREPPASLFVLRRMKASLTLEHLESRMKCKILVYVRTASFLYAILHLFPYSLKDTNVLPSRVEKTLEHMKILR